MKSFTEYLDESFADQYKAVRAAARPGDELLRTNKPSNQFSKNEFGWSEWRGPSTLQSRINGKTPAAILPKEMNQLGSYDPKTRIAHTSIENGIPWKNQVNTNSHELAHAAQHAAQIRDRRSGKIKNRPLDHFMSAEPSFPIVTFPIGTTDKVKPTRSVKRKRKTFRMMQKYGWTGGGSTPEEPRYHYMNRDIEIGARVMGHAAIHLDHPPDPDRPNTTAHMHDLARQLKRGRYKGGNDPVQSSQNVHAAIKRVREISASRWRKAEENHFPPILPSTDKPIPTPRSLRMGERQFRRILQHHEAQLPTDIHTPEGRNAFIRAHGSKKDIKQ